MSARAHSIPARPPAEIKDSLAFEHQRYDQPTAVISGPHFIVDLGEQLSDVAQHIIQRAASLHLEICGFLQGLAVVVLHNCARHQAPNSFTISARGAVPTFAISPPIDLLPGARTASHADYRMGECRVQKVGALRPRAHRPSHCRVTCIEIPSRHWTWGPFMAKRIASMMDAAAWRD